MSHFFRRTLTSISLFILALLLFWAGAPAASVAQKSLSAGDIMLVTVNADGNYNFDFVPLVNLPSGTVIKFTDDAWDGNSFTGSEGIITYTAPQDITAGTVVSYSGADGNGFIETDAGFNPSGSGDNILVYQGDANNPVFIYGAGFAKGSSTVWEYDGSSNTSDIPSGLSESENTIVSLGTDDDLQYDPSNGTEGTKKSLLALVGNADNWNGNDDNAYTALDATFKLVSPPTLTFSTNTQSITEGTIDLTVKLPEANNNDIDVDVMFNADASSATAADFDGATSKTLHFTNASTDDSQTATFQLKTDDGFEGTEKAIFQLKNNSTGTIISPAIQTITIKDSDKSAVIINEFLTDPPDGNAGDANRDGTRDGIEDEFIEIVNSGNVDVDISGWQLSDDGGEDTRYYFPSGTVLAANRAAVIFGGGNPTGGFGGALVFTAQNLSLANSSGEVALLDANGHVLQSVPYGESGEPKGSDESITRNPDITGNFVDYTTADAESGLLFSPGKKIDGTSFGSTYAVGIHGTEGWRFVASPARNTTFDDLFGKIWTQGIAGSDAPSVSTDLANIYSWNETNGGSFNLISSMDDELMPGKGYIVYVYKDDDIRSSGIQGGFPKIVRTNHSENPTTVSVDVSSHDDDNSGSIDGDQEGYNLLGNPFGTDISVGAVISALEKANANVNAHAYIWDNAKSGGAGYEVLNSDDVIEPFQAFFVRFEDSDFEGTATLNRDELAANKGTRFYKKSSEKNPHFALKLADGNQFDTFEVEFSEDGKVGEDRLDAFKLFPLDANSIRLYSTVSDKFKLSENVLPPVNSVDGELRIPLSFDVPHSGKYMLNWSDINSIPDDLKLYLIDNQTGKKIDLRSSVNFSFDITLQTATKKIKAQRTAQTAPLPVLSSEKNSNTRFELLAVSSSTQQKSNEPLQESIVLSPNYPNPFSTYTSMDLKLKEKMHVKVTIWNIVGQKVATLRDEDMPQGTQTVTWGNTANMPSGIYICKVEAGGKVLTRKMTLVK